MALIASIDTANRDIYLSVDTVGASINPIDIYKEMRTLRKTDESLRPYDVFLSAFGAVPKGGGKFTERYVQCNAGTRIIPYDTSHELTVSGVIITDDGQEGVACFDRAPLTATTVVDINYIPPQVEVIRAEAELSALVKTSYSDKVVIDLVNGYAGTGLNINGDYIGTNPAPSNNLTEAKIIADSLGIDTFIVKGTLPITNGDFSNGYFFKGSSPINSMITVANTANIDKCEIWDTVILGDFTGINVLRECLIGGNVTGFSGFASECSFEEITFGLGAGKTAFYECKSNVDGAGSPDIDLNGTGSRVVGRGWVGGVKIKNKTDSLGFSWDHASGHIQILSSVSAGDIILRGIGRSSDFSTGTAIVNDTALMTGTRTIKTVGYVAVKAASGYSGVDFPVGTQDKPVDNIADALALCAKEGVHKIQLLDAVSTVGTEDLSGIVVFGEAATEVSLTVAAGTTNLNTVFRDIFLTGVLDGNNVVIERCSVFNLSGVKNHIYQSFIDGYVKLSGDCSVSFCSIESEASSQTVLFDFDGLGSKVIIDNWGAGIASAGNMPVGALPVGALFGVAGTGGRCAVENTNLGGNVVVGGQIIFNTPNSELLTSFIDSTGAYDVWMKLTALDLASKVTDSVKILKNKTVTDPVAGTLTVYDDDNVSVLYVVNIWENVASSIPYAGNAVNVRERLE